MSSTFKFHSTINEVVPWQAQYAFPTQSTKIAKQTVKLVPKNGNSFTRNQVIRIEFPAENYLNVLNSVLQFDVTLTPPSAVWTSTVTTGVSGANIVADSYSRWVVALAGLPQTSGTRPGAQSVNAYAGFPCTLTASSVTYHNVIESISNDGTNLTIEFLRPWPVFLATATTFTVFPQVVMQPGGAHCHFSRLRVMYGSLVLEDIQEYDTLVRMLYECAVQRDYGSSHGQILDGMASATPKDNGAAFEFAGIGTGYSTRPVTSAAAIAQSLYMPGRKRTFCLNLLSGLLTQKKLVPLKWMASQLVIELTVNNELDALVGSSGMPAAYVAATPAGQLAIAAPASLIYTLTDVNFVAELLEFDSAFDTAFWGGLQQMGVPLKFASWHFHSFPMTGGNQTFQIHERSRSVKAAFAVARSTRPPSVSIDSNRFFNDLGATYTADGDITRTAPAPIESYQFRVGGRYYPAQPVRCLFGAAEAYMELAKAIDNLGDYTRGSQMSAYRWAAYADESSTTQGEEGGEAFIMACGFENVDVSPGTIAGINAEEQSDIAISIKTRGAIAPTDKKLDVFMYYDSLLVIRPGNNVELIM